MKKIILTATNKEVKMGDLVTATNSIETPVGKLDYCITTNITEYTLPELINLNVVRLEDSLTLSDAIEKMAKRANISNEEMTVVLEVVKKVNLAEWATIVLKELAIILDAKYPDHITEAKNVYMIDKSKFTPVLFPEVEFNYQNFAIFRNIEDAKTALEVIKEEVLILQRYHGK